ncbi:MAG: hypothetical protein ACRDYY_00760 [Acidimicrobiales bacterium]
MSKTPAGFTGWLFFVYQDGRVSEVFHYDANTAAGGAFTLQTNASTEAFSTFTKGVSLPPFPQAGATPIGPGHTYSGTYGNGTLTLTGCGAYLYWANPARDVPLESCTFDFYKSSAWA